MKIRIDDTFRSIEEAKNFGMTLFKFKGIYTFNDALRILLTASQLKSFIEKDTRRTFEVLDSKIEVLKVKFSDDCLIED